MSASVEGLPADLAVLLGRTGTNEVESRAARHPLAEGRRPVIRIARYSAYPRVSRSQQVRVGVASNGSDGSLRLTAERRERVGELLRLRVKDLDGDGARDSLARVASCRQRSDRRFDIGLEVVEPNRPRSRPANRRAVSA